MRPWGLLVVMLGGCATQGTTSAGEASATTSGSGASLGSSAPTSGGSSSSSGGETGSSSEASSSGGPAEGLLFADGDVVGLGVTDIRVVDGKIHALGQLQASPGDTVIDLGGRWVAPAFIDSHVHLVYAPAGAEFVARGVAGAVDLAAPVAIFGVDMDPLRVLATGPMVTAQLGYPTQSWGADGYGIECADAAAAVAAVDQLARLGAAAIKLPVTGAPQLTDDALAAAAARAHALGLPVVSHALSDDEARRAALAGADILAHTPTEALGKATIAAWSGRAVISTLRAFGGSATTVNNLKALRAAGVTVLYGTDFGNTMTPGIDGGELALLLQAGLTPQEILTAGTSAPAARWAGFAGALGAIAVGHDASFLVLATDPLADPTVMASAEAVYLRGVKVGP
jgi:imidazolonepropionase-like amidohydrolase